MRNVLISFIRRLKLFYILISHRPFQTVYFNFKMLPFKQAVLLPIFIYSKVEFRSLNGKIYIKGNVYSNMIHIGDTSRYVTTSKPLSIWTINGTMIFNGKINFYHGTYIYIAENAVLSFGSKGTFVGSDSIIICRDSITIGNTVEITWQNQIYDTSFHYIKNNEGTVSPLTKPIVIHDNVWIGNRSTIGKGTILPAFSIIASNSMTNKDYSECGERCLFAGVPAILKRMGTTRIFSSEEEKIYDARYKYIRHKL